MDNHSPKICILSFLYFEIPWCKMQRFASIYIKSAPIFLIQAILSQTGLLIFRKLLKPPQLKYRAPWQTLISPITSVATFECNQLKNIPRKAGPDKNEKQVNLLTRRRENILIYMLPSQQNLDKAKLMQFSKLSQKWFLENNFLGLRSTAAMTTLLLAGQADKKCISKAILFI